MLNFATQKRLSMAEYGVNQISQGHEERDNDKPLEDTLELENIPEVQLNEAVMKTVDNFHLYGSQNTAAQVGNEYEGEIVPDSDDDDEGIHRDEVFVDDTSLPSSCQMDGHALAETIAVGTKRRFISNLCHPELKCAAENAFCIEDKGHVLGNLELIEDIEKEDNSRDFFSSRKMTSDHYAKVVEMQKDSKVDSVDFLDQYLSAHLEDVAPWVASLTGKKSHSSISNAKGLESSIARLANLKSKVKDKGVFKWVDDNKDKNKHNYFYDSNHLLPGSISVEDMNLRKQRIYPTNHCLDVNEKLRDFSISSGRMHVSGVRRTANDVLREPKLESGNVSSKELEASVEDKVADFYEVGIGTQIAAEAMEALYYTDPPCDTPAVSANQERSIVCSKKMKRKSSTSVEDYDSGDGLCQEPAKKVRTHNKHKAKGNLKGGVQSKSRRNIRKEEICMENSGRTSDDNCQNGEIKVEDTLNLQRKISLKVSFEVSADGRNSSISQGDEKQQGKDAILNLQNLIVLDYPRGKRTRRVKMGSCARGSSFVYPVKLLKMKKHNMDGIRTQGNLECNSDSEPFPFRCPIKRKKRTSVYRSRCISISLKNENDSVKVGTNAQFKSPSSLCLGKDGVLSVKSYDSVSAASYKCRMSTNELHQSDNKNKSGSLLTRELVCLGCVESMPNFISKDLRRRRTMANIQVLLSQNLEEDIMKQQKKILTWFGVPMASCPSDATHFVADKFTRTRNMLEVIALGKPVVTHLWLESCKEAGFCINERKYILRDVKKERELGFSLPDSLIQAQRQPLLRGYKVYVTPNVKPAHEVISSLVNTLQAEQVVEEADGKLMDDLLILSCEEDYADCIPFLEKGATAYTSELLLNGVIIQKLEFQRYKLSFK